MLVTIFGCCWRHFDIDSISNPKGPVPTQFISPEMKNRWFSIWVATGCIICSLIMKINHQIFYQGSVNLRTVRFGSFGFSEDDWQSLVHPSKGVLRSNLPKSRKHWSADHHVTPYLGRSLTFCSRFTQPRFLNMKRCVNLTDWICDLILSRKIFNIRTSLICSKLFLVRKLIFDFKLAL